MGVQQLNSPSLFNLEQKPSPTIPDLSDSFLKRAAQQGVVAIDIETSGLDWRSERIGLCQVALVHGDVSLLKCGKNAKPERFLALLADPSIQKIFHHAMFDLRFLAYHWGAQPANIGCTKIASKLIDPEQKEGHSLVCLLEKYLGIKIDKSERQSDWLAWDLSESQLAYASGDVVCLPQLFDILMKQLRGKDRVELATRCFDHIPTRVKLEILGFGDVFSY